MNLIRPLFFVVFLGYAVSIIPVHAMAFESSVQSKQIQNRSTQRENRSENFSFFDSIISFFTQSSTVQAVIGVGFVALAIGLILKWAKSKNKSVANHTSNPFMQQVAIGAASMPGIEFSAGNVRIIQLPVLPQQGLSCGYHALKNGILIAQGQFDQLHDEKLAERLFHYQTSDDWFANIGLWRGAVKESQNLNNGGHYNGSIDDISTAALELLIKHEKTHSYLLHKKLNNIDIIAIDDIKIIGAPVDIAKTASGSFSAFKENLIAYDYITPEIKENLERIKHAKQGFFGSSISSYTAIFLINTGHEYQDGNKNQRGTQGNHWFTVVLSAQGDKHTYYVTDSLGSVRVPREAELADRRLQRLVNTIESSEILF